MNDYITILIPPVDRDNATEWHGPDTLSRGAFQSQSEAIAWAREHLNGTPYSLRVVTADSDRP